MLFKHPFVLYALLALLIPIIIHLFKLRKFQKIAFTNVAFLEKIKLQSRKSSQLKKWLILLSRLGIFTALIIAFAFPYLPTKSNSKQPEHYIIYLDNSFSMQAEGKNGPILKRAIQDIATIFNDDTIFTLFTNTEVFQNVRFSDVQNEILDIPYTPEQLSPEQILLKAKKLSKNIVNSAFVVISDFQKKASFDYNILKAKANHIIQLKPQKTTNTSIDSLWVTTTDSQKTLNIATYSSDKSTTATLSVLNGKNLIGKASINFSTEAHQITQVPIPQNTRIEGLARIDNTEGLSFDNFRYFSLNQTPKPKVLVIGSAFYNFLQKIYVADEFDFLPTTITTVKDKDINAADIIILNEIKKFPNNIEQSLIEFTKQGGTLCIIPSASKNSNLESFLNSNFNIKLENYTKTQKKLTQISFQHPLFNEVFTKKTINFQYPTIKEGYTLNSKNWVLNLEDNSSFLIQKDKLFVFTSPLNKQVTNFKNSPLIVPLFYNMTKQNSSSTSKIYHTIGKENAYNVSTNQNQDEVLTLKNSTDEFIPLQQVFKNYVKISTNDLPKKSGNYHIISNNNYIQNVSYNYDTKESSLNYVTFFDIKNFKYSNSVSGFFETSKAQFKTIDLWKWFLIFALFFVIVEIILLKFLK